MFVDQIRIHGKAGNGGNGCASFRREKFEPKGGPDGGDGGNGGHVILQADVHTDNLVSLHYEPIIRAKDGARGMSRQMTGRSAQHTIIKVPVGTVIYDLPAELGPNQPPPVDTDGIPLEKGKRKRNLDLSQLEVLGDLTEEGQEFVICQGGKGGKGNIHFKSSRNRTPLQFQEGTPGEEGFFLLELRKIADAGLVGFPNAGKSTLLTAISAAHPRIAAYPFTTLHPHIGVVELGDVERYSVADIPGLIEGAHRNVGLGHDFLRHITRCRLLLFVLDMAGSEGREPIADLENLRTELRLYDPRLGKRPWVVIANKMDVEGAEEKLHYFKLRFPDTEVIEVSASDGTGIDALKTRVGELVIEHTPEEESV